MARIAHVVDVAVVGPHQLRLVFDDGVSGVVDFSALGWRGVFSPLVDEAFFCRVAVDAELGTIVWPNGADIAPETLHLWVLTGQAPGLTAVS